MIGAADGPYPRHFGRIGRLVCGVAAALGLMAAIPAVASAALSIAANGVTLQRTMGPPGSVLIGGINTSGANGVSNSTVTVTRTVASSEPSGITTTGT